jgi:uncharacterized protein (TIGR02231 family)
MEETQKDAIEYLPPIDPTRTRVASTVARVTVLEDRAQVTRAVTIELEAGQQRLALEAISPLAQDVSVRAAVVAGEARATDASMGRAMRVKRADRPAERRELDAEIREMERGMRALNNARERAQERFMVVGEMITRGAAELPQDAAWGDANAARWGEMFGALFGRASTLQQAELEAAFGQEDLAKDLGSAYRRRALMARTDQEFVAWAEVDVEVAEAGPITLELEYMVPNAMWRPTHTARLVDGALEWTSRGAVWQHTGEDWDGVELTLSTAQMSLGHEPAVLTDDLLQVKRKEEEVELEVREVAVQSASVKGGGGGAPAPAPRGVDLPGVDDGGEVQRLGPDGPASVPSDGRPCFVDLFGFQGQPSQELVLMAEAEPRVILRTVQPNGAGSPILAGPVELVEGTGVVGWTKTLFVAPGEAFELGFGPVDAVRVRRDVTGITDKVDEVDRWRRVVQQVTLYVSNLDDQARAITVTERIPVSEVEHIRVRVIEDRTTPGWSIDEDGFVTWKLELGARAKEELRLRWEMATAPGVSLKG